jgi:hypothetical protein
MVPSEYFSAKSIKNSDAILISTETMPSEMDLAPPASFVNKTASSEDIYFDASDKKTSSENFSNFTNAPISESAVEHVAAATVISEKTNKTKSEEKPAPTMPSVNEII